MGRGGERTSFVGLGLLKLEGWLCQDLADHTAEHPCAVGHVEVGVNRGVDLDRFVLVEEA